MSEAAEAESIHVDALMHRMLGHLLLFGSAVLFVLLLILLSLPRVDGIDGRWLVLPGLQARHVISALALPVLGAGALVLGLPGLLMLALGRRGARFASVRPGPSRTASFRRPMLILLGGLVLLAVVLLRR